MDDVLEYLYGLTRFGSKPGLDVIQALLAALDNPHEAFRSVLVAGTNGKGSVVAMLESVCRTAGYSTGRYTSPHLFVFNERILVNGVQISDEDLVRLTMRVRTAAESANLAPTFFECTTAIAFCYFAEQGIDLAVVEVGCGGRLDATNVLTPIVSVITQIGLDHTHILGDTLVKIAREKAGIIKQGVPVVAADTSWFVQRCKEMGAPLFHAPVAAVGLVSESLRWQELKVGGMHVRLGLVGAHQRANAAVALRTIEVLRTQGFAIPERAVKEGFAGVRWSGRLEVLSESPLIIVDGAHNVQGLTALCEFVTRLERRKVLIVGLSEGRDPVMLKRIADMFEHVIVTKGAFKPQETRTVAEALAEREVDEEERVRDAVDRALDILEPEDTCVITGSLYMIPAAIQRVRELQK